MKTVTLKIKFYPKKKFAGKLSEDDCYAFVYRRAPGDLVQTEGFYDAETNSFHVDEALCIPMDQVAMIGNVDWSEFYRKAEEALAD